MSCSKLVPWAHSNLIQHEFDDGFCFRLPSSKNNVGMSLSSISIIDGEPKLGFEYSPKMPIITEEDLAIAILLALEEQDPCFYYRNFSLGHPFAGMGRLFKGYSPMWLRGTSIGELEAEADWAMKCLHVGVRSNEDKTKFWLWNKSSNLKGLKTREDFNENFPGATIVMDFESIDVNEQNQELYFVGNPCPRIHCVCDGKNSEYAEYVTKHFNSVAYHDEPSFLKMQQIVKLVVAMKWLKKKLEERNQTFSRTWINEHLEKRYERQSERVEATPAPQKTQQIEDEKSEDLALPGLPQMSSETCIEFKRKASILGLESEITCKATYNNYDFLLEGEDPNQPYDIELDKKTGEAKLLTPDVKSWNKLMAQTVPQPCTALYTPNGYIGPLVTGGVSTRNLTTNQVRSEHRPRNEAFLSANAPLKELKTPKPSKTVIPPSNVSAVAANSGLRKTIQNAGIKSGPGFCDNRGVKIWSENGDRVLVQEKKLEGSIRVSVKQEAIQEFDCPHEVRELRRDGTRGPKIKIHKQLLPPHAKGRNLAEECANATSG